MNATTGRSPVATPPITPFTWAWLGVLGLLVLAVRLRYFHEPFDNDISIRMQYVMRHLQGADYYSDLWVFGPPGSLWINEVFVRLFGATELAVYAMGCTFSLLTLVGLYKLGTLLVDTRAGLLASAFWVALNFGITTEANQPNSEVYIIAAMVWAFYFLFHPRRHGFDRHALAAGLLFFLATSVKHHMVLMPACALLLHSLSGWRAAPPTTGLDVGRWARMALVGTACWALLTSWYFATGRFEPFIEGMVGKSIAYAASEGDIITNLVKALGPYWLIQPQQRPMFALYVLLAGMCVFGWFQLRQPVWLVIIGWVIGTWLAISVPGRFYPHYYTLWHPLLALGAGCALASLLQAAAGRWAVPAKAFAAVLMAVTFGYQLTQVARLDAAGAVMAKYGERFGTLFTETRDIGLRLREEAVDKTIFELGVYGLYFYTGSTPPMPFVDSLYGAPQDQLGDTYARIMLPSLLKAPPNLLIVRREFLTDYDADPRADMYHALSKRLNYIENISYSSKSIVVLSGETQTQPDTK